MSETDISRCIQDALAKAGVLVVRVHSGKVKVKGGWMQLARKGTPDLWTEWGWIEVKKPGKVRSPEQVKWAEDATAKGINVGVTDSVLGAFELVNGWRKLARTGT